MSGDRCVRRLATSLLSTLIIGCFFCNRQADAFGIALSSPRRQTFQHKPLGTLNLNNGRGMQRLTRLHAEDGNNEKTVGFFDDLNFAKIDIPDEVKDEILKAEANTPAAQGRTQRIIGYLFVAIVGLGTAFFNAFLHDLRFGEGSPSSDLDYYGFGWVKDNFLLSFAFTNGIGGIVGLLSTGIGATMAELEYSSRKENAEKIWAEMQRRSATRSKKTKKEKRRTTSKKSMSGKQRKRISALSELMVEDKEEVEVGAPSNASYEAPDIKEGEKTDPEKEKEGTGVLGKLKSFYDKADSMAASQALLLNKKLEEEGVLEKVTDESGLKVIGKDAAAKLKEESKKEEETSKATAGAEAKKD